MTERERLLGIKEAVAIGLGIILGSGIFVSPAGIAAATGSVGEALIIWIACGLFSTLGALCFAELGVRIPKAGGDYTYIYEVFGPLWAFVRIWIEVIVIRPSSHAIVALTFAEYALQPLYESGEKAPSSAIQLLGISCVGFLTCLNCTSVKWSTRLQTASTVGKVAALILIIALGIVAMAQGHYDNFKGDVLFEGSLTDPGKITVAIYAGMWAFSGWNEINYIIDEIKNPSKNLTISIVITISVTTVLYLAVNVSYFMLLTPEEMAVEEATAIVFGRMMLGDYGFIISICVALSCFGSINGSMLTSSRLFFTGACNGHLPVILSMININSLSPTPSISLISLLTLLYMTTDDVFALINCCAFVYFSALGFAILGLIVHRFRKPDKNVSLKFPLIIPILAVIMCLGTGFMSFLESPVESGIGFGLTLTAVPVYLLFVIAPKPSAVKRILSKQTVVLQCLTLSVPEEK